MTEKKEPKLLELLGEALPEEAIQRTKKEQTHKSYDTDGYSYQYCVDRFNDLLGEQWGFEWEILKESEGKYSTGKPYYDITAKVSIWINNRENVRSSVGGHVAVLYADALKGAITNAFKKTAAFWGVGRQAYQGGVLDDDNKPLPEEETQSQRQSSKPAPKPSSKPEGEKKDMINAEMTRKIEAACLWVADFVPEKAVEYYHLWCDDIENGVVKKKQKPLNELTIKQAYYFWGQRIKPVFEKENWDIDVALHEYDEWLANGKKKPTSSDDNLPF